MLATTGTAIPAGPEWVHEIKWDGVRVLADLSGGRLTLASRNGNDVTVAYPELAPLASLYADALLDAEIVAFEEGAHSFGTVVERMHVRNAAKALALSQIRPVTLMVFDILRLFGSNLTDQPWHARRQLLEQLELESPRWHVPPVYDDGEGLLAATAEQGLEGVISKRRTSIYTPGRRSPDWVKVAHRPTISALVGGWRPETDSESRLGAILVGIPDPGGLQFIGRVGSGLAGKAGVAMARSLAGAERADSPFANEIPREDALGTRWVEPRLVVDVRSLGLSNGGRLRQPSFIGLRPDLTSADLGPSDA